MHSQVAGQEQRVLCWFITVTAEDDMGAGNVLGMEPDIPGIGGFEGEPVVLIVVLAHQDLSAVRGGKFEIGRASCRERV